MKYDMVSRWRGGECCVGVGSVSVLCCVVNSGLCRMWSHGSVNSWACALIGLRAPGSVVSWVCVLMGLCAHGAVVSWVCVLVGLWAHGSV